MSSVALRTEMFGSGRESESELDDAAAAAATAVVVGSWVDVAGGWEVESTTGSVVGSTVASGVTDCEVVGCGLEPLATNSA